MKHSAELHEEAMELADVGDHHRRCGNPTGALWAFVQALEAERKAAELENTEPSRGILFRSAAWLALEADQPREAERLAAEGLRSSAVSEHIAGELRAVMEVAWGKMRAAA